MTNFNRDLLVLSGKTGLTPQEMEQEVQSLHILLYGIENLDTFCTANEIINLNTYKIIRKPHLIQKHLREISVKPFLFICNKN